MSSIWTGNFLWTYSQSIVRVFFEIFAGESSVGVSFATLALVGTLVLVAAKREGVLATAWRVGESCIVVAWVFRRFTAQSTAGFEVGSICVSWRLAVYVGASEQAQPDGEQVWVSPRHFLKEKRAKFSEQVSREYKFMLRKCCLEVFVFEIGEKKMEKMKSNFEKNRAIYILKRDSTVDSFRYLVILASSNCQKVVIDQTLLGS